MESTQSLSDRGLWWEWERPESRRASFRAHFHWAFLSGLTWGASFLIPYQTPIQLCGVLRWTGYPCMFCGLTRSMSALSQGAWTFAVHNAPIAVLLYAGMVGLFLWHTTGLMTGTIIRPGNLWRRVPTKAYIAVAIGLVLINWAYRLAMGLK